MRKRICLIGLLFALITITTPVLAADSSYDLPEIDISVTIPDSYVVITNETIDDVIYEYVGSDLDSSERAALKELLLSPGTYMILWSQNDFEVTIAVQDNSYKNESFADYSDSEIIEEYGGAVTHTLEQRGAKVLGKPEIFQHPQIKMCKVAYSLTSDGSTRYLLSYTTVLNGKTYNFLFSSYKPILHQTNAVNAREIMEGVRFNKLSSSSSSPSNNPSWTSSNTRNKQNSLLGSAVGAILLGLIITFLIHPLPIIIYRYGIKKEPVAPKKATKIAIIDAIIVFLIWVGINVIFITSTGSAASSISTPAIVVWTFICRSILTKGYQTPALESGGDNKPGQSGEAFLERMVSLKKEEDFAKEVATNEGFHNPSESAIKSESLEEVLKRSLQSNNTNETVSAQINPKEDSVLVLPENKNAKAINEQENLSDKQDFSKADEQLVLTSPTETIYCRKCGFKLYKGSIFCSKCGTPVEQNQKESGIL